MGDNDLPWQRKLLAIYPQKWGKKLSPITLDVTWSILSHFTITSYTYGQVHTDKDLGFACVCVPIGDLIMSRVPLYHRLYVHGPAPVRGGGGTHWWVLFNVDSTSSSPAAPPSMHHLRRSSSQNKQTVFVCVLGTRNQTIRERAGSGIAGIFLKARLSKRSLWLWGSYFRRVKDRPIDHHFRHTHRIVV